MGETVLQPPVSLVLPSLLEALHRASTVLLSAPTGAGKSTWLPLQLLQDPQIEGRILLLEPRRIAARSVALRLADQLGETVGSTVGYRMRSESKVSAQTRLEVVTEGILTRLLQADPALEGVGMVILDEFHERSLQADLGLALLLEVQQGLRSDLKVLIMSATLDNIRLQSVLPEAPMIVSEGRSFPVTRQYHALSPHESFDEAVTKAVVSLLRQQAGSLLLFLPGVAEILRVKNLLSDRVSDQVDLCPLYGALSQAEQQQAIQPAPTGRRKVVLATNIAETSLTIEGITLVVDSALEREAHWDPRSGLTRLVTQKVSKASMAQRAGRAGRLAPGVCWHLISKEQAERASEHAEPEILRQDLCSLWLELAQWGCRESTDLVWLDPPPASTLRMAKQRLKALEALDDKAQLTQRGREMGKLGCEPRLAAMLLAAKEEGADAVATATLLAALLEEPPRGRGTDLTESLNSPERHWQVRARQLQKRLGSTVGQVSVELAPWLLSVGFADRIALQRGQGERYLMANGLGACLDEGDPLSQSPCLIVPHLLQVSRNPDARILLALPVELDSLRQRLPHLFEIHTTVSWDEQKGTLQTWQCERLGELVLQRKPLSKPPAEQLKQALLNWLRENGLQQLAWDEPATQLCLRMQCAQAWLPDWQGPSADEQSLLDSLESWLLPFMQGVSDVRGLRKIPLVQALESRLDWAQRQRLESALPTHYTVPTGSRLPIRYDQDNPPVLAVRLQEIFGEQTTPIIAEGRVSLVLELLSPAQRPLQITRDLAAFWQGSYREVQKEMKGRYPKHVWPDDPANALPTRRTKRAQARE